MIAAGPRRRINGNIDWNTNHDSIALPDHKSRTVRAAAIKL